jgi:hypothetical protein
VFRHRFDPAALVAGVLFLTIAIRYLVQGLGGPDVTFPWAMPAVLGTVILVSALRVIFRSRRRDPAE